jgi:hypothetical protein
MFPLSLLIYFCHMSYVPNWIISKWNIYIIIKFGLILFFCHTIWVESVFNISQLYPPFWILLDNFHKPVHEYYIEGHVCKILISFWWTQTFMSVAICIFLLIRFKTFSVFLFIWYLMIQALATLASLDYLSRASSLTLLLQTI